MPRRRIRAHYVHMSELERGSIIELKEGCWANRRIALYMGRSDAAFRTCWQELVDNSRFQRHDVFSDEFRIQLCPDKHRRRVWRRPEQRADPAFTISGYTGPQQGVIVWGALSFEAGPLWSSLEAHLHHIDTSTAF
ncbi:uncharacterized protein TNCV_4608131 [Trichonephila clavipes]|nr:uncharacterized protein TNCV_4608131 [Trichonephila clavipes]